MNTKTAFVLALCAVAIAAVPDSDIVPEDTHHAHLRDIRSAMDALTHLPHTETARKDTHLRELRFAVDALTSKVNTMAMQLQTAPPSDSMSLVQMLPTIVKRDVAKPTGPAVLDDKLHSSSQKFLAMRTAIKDKMGMGRDKSDRGDDEKTLAAKKKKLADKRDHISGNSHSSKHLGRIGAQCYEEIENYVVGMAEFLDDFKSELKLKFESLEKPIVKPNTGCNIVQDITKGKIRQTCQFSVVDVAGKVARQLKTSNGYKHVLDVKYSDFKSGQAKTANTLKQIVKLDEQLHEEMESERECGANRVKRVIEAADDVAAFIYKHVALFQDEVNGFCAVVKDADAPAKVVYETVAGKNKRKRLVSTTPLKTGEKEYTFEGDKKLQTICEKPKGGLRYQAFFGWLYDVAFGQYSAAQATFPFFEVSASNMALAKLKYGGISATALTFGPEAFATDFARKTGTKLTSKWSWLQPLINYYNDHKSKDWKDSQCVHDSKLTNPLLQVWQMCSDMFDSVSTVQNKMESFWKEKNFNRKR